jgi:hypothetical protein
MKKIFQSIIYRWFVVVVTSCALLLNGCGMIIVTADKSNKGNQPVSDDSNQVTDEQSKPITTKKELAKTDNAKQEIPKIEISYMPQITTTKDTSCSSGIIAKQKTIVFDETSTEKAYTGTALENLFLSKESYRANLEVESENEKCVIAKLVPEGDKPKLVITRTGDGHCKVTLSATVLGTEIKGKAIIYCYVGNKDEIIKPKEGKKDFGFTNTVSGNYTINLKNFFDISDDNIVYDVSTPVKKSFIEVTERKDKDKDKTNEWNICYNGDDVKKEDRDVEYKITAKIKDTNVTTSINIQIKISPPKVWRYDVLEQIVDGIYQKIYNESKSKIPYKKFSLVNLKNEVKPFLDACNDWKKTIEKIKLEDEKYVNENGSVVKVLQDGIDNNLNKKFDEKDKTIIIKVIEKINGYEKKKLDFFESVGEKSLGAQIMNGYQECLEIITRYEEEKNDDKNTVEYDVAVLEIQDISNENGKFGTLIKNLNKMFNGLEQTKPLWTKEYFYNFFKEKFGDPDALTKHFDIKGEFIQFFVTNKFVKFENDKFVVTEVCTKKWGEEITDKLAKYLNWQLQLPERIPPFPRRIPDMQKALLVLALVLGDPVLVALFLLIALISNGDNGGNGNEGNQNTGETGTEEQPPKDPPNEGTTDPDQKKEEPRPEVPKGKKVIDSKIHNTSNGWLYCILGEDDSSPQISYQVWKTGIKEPSLTLQLGSVNEKRLSKVLEKNYKDYKIEPVTPLNNGTAKYPFIITLVKNDENDKTPFDPKTYGLLDEDNCQKAANKIRILWTNEKNAEVLNPYLPDLLMSTEDFSLCANINNVEDKSHSGYRLAVIEKDDKDDRFRLYFFHQSNNEKPAIGKRLHLPTDPDRKRLEDFFKVIHATQKIDFKFEPSEKKLSIDVNFDDGIAVPFDWKEEEGVFRFQ